MASFTRPSSRGMKMVMKAERESRCEEEEGGEAPMLGP
jgi:hypothetical protein